VGDTNRLPHSHITVYGKTDAIKIYKVKIEEVHDLTQDRYNIIDDYSVLSMMSVTILGNNLTLQGQSVCMATAE